MTKSMLFAQFHTPIIVQFRADGTIERTYQISEVSLTQYEMNRKTGTVGVAENGRGYIALLQPIGGGYALVGTMEQEALNQEEELVRRIYTYYLIDLQVAEAYFLGTLEYTGKDEIAIAPTSKGVFINDGGVMRFVSADELLD